MAQDWFHREVKKVYHKMALIVLPLELLRCDLEPEWRVVWTGIVPERGARPT